ncbi:hypothetical protein CsSME_00029331 [Camellia sinensis var. sinensis]
MATAALLFGLSPSILHHHILCRRSEQHSLCRPPPQISTSLPPPSQHHFYPASVAAPVFDLDDGIRHTAHHSDLFFVFFFSNCC